jgi:hypothetical protein
VCWKNTNVYIVQSDCGCVVTVIAHQGDAEGCVGGWVGGGGALGGGGIELRYGRGCVEASIAQDERATCVRGGGGGDVYRNHMQPFITTGTAIYNALAASQKAQAAVQACRE